MSEELARLLAVAQETRGAYDTAVVDALDVSADTARSLREAVENLAARVQALEDAHRPPPPPESNAEAAAGVWVLQNVESVEELRKLATPLTQALAMPGVRGLSVRTGWKALDTDFGVFDEARSLADEAGSELMVRFMAGRSTPARFLGRSYTDVGDAIPVPYLSDGSPNLVFEAGYAALVEDLAAWCRASRVRVLHCAWYGRRWAEYDHEYVVRAVPLGYSLAAWQEAHRRLLRTAMEFVGPDLAVEFPGSGYPGSPSPGLGGILNLAADAFGDRNDRVFHQANGWPIYTGRATDRLHLGLQPYSVTMAATRTAANALGRVATPPTWDSAFAQAREDRIGALYAEVYLPAFAEPEWAAQLAEQAGRFAETNPALTAATT